MVREGVTQEVDVLACDLAGEDMAILLLTTAQELERVSPKLQSATQIGDEAIFHCRFTRLPVDMKYNVKTIQTMDSDGKSIHFL